MNKFLEKCNLLKVKEEEAESLKRSITADEIEAILKKSPIKKSTRLDGFREEFNKAFKEELTPILHRLLKNIK